MIWFQIASFVVLLIGWLIVSFTEPSRTRTVIEWVSTTALYSVLVSIFGSIVHRAWIANGTVQILGVDVPRMPVLLGFGFLALIFATGFVVSVFQTLNAAREQKKIVVSTTN